MRKIAISFAIGVIFIILASQSVSAEKYTVKQGDNLWNISDEYDISVSELMDINDLETVVIEPDQEIYIYETYDVKRGDTLSEIGKTYDVSVEQLQEWNDLSSDLIITGEELTIHALHDDLIKKEKKRKKEADKAKSKSKQTKETATKPQAKEAEQKVDKQAAGQTMTVTATAYTAQCDGCSGVTYTGVNLNENRQAKVIAVDPNVIPLGSEVHVEGYGNAIAADIGGAIKGNKIDIHVPTKSDAKEWGVRTVNITILD
ncbi:MAG TPA: LysM peptidoglycan-binding domain-containing protein [Bacillota bacterium]|nr:LysM peptidoglycan-binding domain-containing protein [Bacillota bacterium]